MKSDSVIRPSLICNDRGAVLVITAIILASVISLAGFLWNRVGGFVYTQGRAILDEKVLSITEGGLDKAIWELNEDSSYVGEVGTSFGDGTFDIVVTEIDSTTRLISSTGYIPNASLPIAQKTIEIEVLNSGSVVSFPYGMQAGDEGITVGAGVSVNGSAYSNGDVIVGDNSAITGDVTIGGNESSGLITSYETNTSEYAFGNNSSRRDVAVSFVPLISGDLSHVELFIRKTGSPGNLRLRLMTNNAGSPSTTELGSGQLNSSWVTGALNWVTVGFSSIPTVVAGNTYWLVLDGNSSTSHYYRWGSDSGVGYSGVTKASSNYTSGSWSLVASHDVNFRVFEETSNTSFIGASGVTVGGDLRANHIANVAIAGDAYYQTIVNATAINYYPGTEDSPLIDLPISQAQIDDWKAEAEAGGVHSGDYTACGTSIGPLKITGELILWNNCDITITGTVWVEGIIDMRNGSDMVLDSSFGGNGGVVISDLHLRVETSSSIQGSGDGDSYMLMISLGVGPSETREAIEIHSGDVDIEDAILFAPEGVVDIQEGGATLLELAGKGIELADFIGLFYEQGLANAAIGGGGTSGWNMRDGTWQEK